VTSADQRRPARETLVYALVIVATTVLVFAGSLDGAFVSDDVMLVQNNPLVRSLSPANIRMHCFSRVGLRLWEHHHAHARSAIA